MARSFKKKWSKYFKNTTHFRVTSNSLSHAHAHREFKRRFPARSPQIFFSFSDLTKKSFRKVISFVHPTRSKYEKLVTSENLRCNYIACFHYYFFFSFLIATTSKIYNEIINHVYKKKLYIVNKGSDDL